MKTIISAHRKWLALALFVLAAGFCYSCETKGEPEGVFLTLEAAVEEHTGDVSGTGEDAPAMAGAASALEGFGSSKAPAEQPGQNGSRDGSRESDDLCYVHVCGEVVCPGVYQLMVGQRVFEAVELAGGFTDAAADAFLNLAEPVFDGMKVEVPDREKAESLAAGQEKPESSAGGKINLNTATREELMTLRGIGQARAEDILAYRQQHGKFGRIEDIMEVPGIKEAAFQKIRDDITV